MKKLYILLFMFTFFAISYANTNDWVVRITTDSTNVIELSTADLKSEISNYALMNGVEYSAMKDVLSTDIGLWQFVSQIIDLEVLYIQAKQNGYSEKEDVVKSLENEIDRQMAEAYAPQILNTNALVVSENEKINFWNKEQYRIKGMYGNSLTYKDIEREIANNLMQEKMKLEYKKLIEKYKKIYNIEYSSTKDPCIIIEDIKVPKADFDETFEAAIKTSGQSITGDILAQARADLFQTFLAQQIMLYESKKSAFDETEEWKKVEKLIKRSIITRKFIEDEIFSKIEDSTEEEIEEAYKQFGAAYNIDSLPYSQAEVLLDSLVKQSKVEEKQRTLSSNLRYKYKIEKNLNALKDTL